MFGGFETKENIIFSVTDVRKIFFKQHTNFYETSAYTTDNVQMHITFMHLDNLNMRISIPNFLVSLTG